MTSFLEVLAHEDDNDTRKVRQASTTAKIRSDAQFRAWIEGATSPSDQLARLSFVQEEIVGIAHVAADEFGVPGDTIARSVINSYRPVADNTREAAIHEARLPRMCPYHKDVVNISLAQGDPKSGFEAMAQHWGGPRHCEGDGYKGESCKFKPEMTTQSYWDDRKDQLEQKRQERAEREQAVEEPMEEELEAPVDDAPIENESPESEGAEVIPFPTQQSDGGAQEAAEPMSMAASTAGFQAVAAGPVGHGVPHPTTPGFLWDAQLNKYVPAEKLSQPTQGYLQRTPDGGMNAIPAEQPGAWAQARPGGGFNAYATDTTGLGGPEPKMDKRKWTPQTVGEPKLEGDESRNPTKRKDIVQPVRPSDEPGENNLKEIGENKTEHQDVTRDGGIDTPDQGGVWTDGPRSAISTKLPDDVDKNPIRALMTGEYDGFLPQNVVQQAVSAYRGR
jgi:hypothetical protein